MTCGPSAVPVVARVSAAFVVLLVAGASPARGVTTEQPERFAVVIGNNKGASQDLPLRYAERDAERLADGLLRVGGFARDHIAVLDGASVDVVRGTIIAMNDRARQSPGAALLFVYYSGHADADALHIDGERFALDELEALVRGSSAGFRVLVLDACRSGAVTAVKGGRPTSSFALPARSSASANANGPHAEGYVVLTAAAAGEDAQESEKLRGSFFTHHLVSGLLGAADDDSNDEVTLEEAYRYAFQETVRASSATLAGTQHPTFRYDVRGRGDIVLAHLSAVRTHEASITLPADVDVLLFHDDGRDAGDVALEVRAAPRSRRVLVPPGRYLVRARGRDVLFEGIVAAAAGADRVVRVEELERIEYAQLVRKGESERGWLVQPHIGAHAHSPWFDGGAPCVGAVVAVPVEMRLLTVVPRVSLCAARWQNRFLVGRETETMMDVVIAHVFDVPFVALSTGATVGAMVLQQSFETSGSAPPLTSMAPSLGVVAGAQVPLPLGASVSASIEARSTLMRLTKTQTWVTPLSVGGQLGLGWSL